MFPLSGNWETRISGVTTVKKAWADSVDAALGGLYGGTRTVVSLSADALGDRPSTAAAGDVAATGKVHGDAGVETAAGNVSALVGNLVAAAGHLEVGQSKVGTAMPTPACVLGQLYSDLIPIGWGRFFVSGGAISLSAGINIKSATRSNVGQYRITFGTAPGQPLFQSVVLVTPWGVQDVSFNCNTTGEAFTGNLQILMTARSIGGAPVAVDASFFLVAYCGRF